jgi:hypothetical protein
MMERGAGFKQRRQIPQHRCNECELVYSIIAAETCESSNEMDGIFRNILRNYSV